MSKLNQIGTHKTNIYTENNFTCIKYHYTDVVKFNDKKIILNSGNWQTNTTKLRMNQAANQFNLNFIVYQKNNKWFVMCKNNILDFFDGIELTR